MESQEKELNAILSRGYGSTTEIFRLALGSDLVPEKNPPLARMDVPIRFKNNFDPNTPPNPKTPNASSATSVGIYLHYASQPDIFSWRSDDSTLPIVFGKKQEICCRLTNQSGYFPHKLSVLVHEATHLDKGIHNSIRKVLTPTTNIGESYQWGCGEPLEKIFVRFGSKAQTQIRHADLEVPYKNSNKGNGSAWHAYAIQAGENEAILSQIFSMALWSGCWKRLPENKEELWAAYHNLVGQPVQAEGTALGAFLKSDRCRELKAEFPAKELLAKWPFDPANPKSDTVIKERVEGLQKGLLWLLKTPAAQAAFYEEALTDMYARWRETTFGDLDARSKLGLPAGNFPAEAAAFQIIYSPQKLSGVKTWTAEEWKEMAAKIDPAMHEKLLGLAIHYENPLAVEVLLETNKTAGTGCGYGLTPAQLDKIAAFAGEVYRQDSSDKKPATAKILRALIRHGASADAVPIRDLLPIRQVLRLEKLRAVFAQTPSRHSAQPTPTSPTLVPAQGSVLAA